MVDEAIYFAMKVLFFFLILVFTCSCSLTGKIGDNVITQSYKPDLQVDIWMPDQKRELYPVVITVHGGSWSSRSRQDMNNIAKRLSKRGYAVLNVSYRLVPKAYYPAPIQDVKDLIKWAIQNKNKYNLDMTRLNFWGYSAGSQISTLTALQINDQVPVTCVINGAGPMDMTIAPDSEPVIKYLQGSSFEKLKEASPAYWVKENSPPVFTYHSTNDHIVYFKHAEIFHSKLNEKRVENELYSIPLLGHVLTFLISGSAVDKAIDFLDTYNFLSHNETENR